MLPVFFNTPERMLNIGVVTVKHSSDSTFNLLRRAGVIHLEESTELNAVNRADIERKRSEITGLLGLLDSMLAYAPEGAEFALDEESEVICTGQIEEIRKEIHKDTPFFDNLRSAAATIDHNIGQLSLLKSGLAPFASRNEVALKDLRFDGAYLFSRIFALPEEGLAAVYERLKPLLLESYVYPAEGQQLLYAIGRSGQKATIEQAVRQVGGKPVEVPDSGLDPSTYLATLDDEIGRLRAEQKAIYAELGAKIKGKLERLVLLREALKAEGECMSALEKASEAKYVTLIRGWVPEKELEPVSALLKENIDGVYVDVRKPGPNEEPPSKYKNPRPMTPFQVVVSLFGIPGYREWDPTPIISYSFAIFFGLMSADVVYAIGVMLLGKYLLPKFVDDPRADNFRLLQRLVYTCAGVGLVAGLLSGSYMGDFYRMFGFSELAVSRTFASALSNPLNFIILAVSIGYIHVNIAHIIAFVKAIKMKDKITILDKVGLFLLQLGLPSILHGILRINFPFFTPQLYSTMLYVMYGGIALIFVAFWLQRPGLGLILGLFEVIGLLGDVLSYARIAGVGLATYYLAFSFNLMSDVFRGLFAGFLPGIIGVVVGSIVGIGILIFGHSLNTLLAGISPFVHSLRLCFVEFLMKFYDGAGKEYTPFKIRKRALVGAGARS